MSDTAKTALRAKREYAESMRYAALTTRPRIVLDGRCRECGQYRGSKIHRAHSRGSVKGRA